MASEGVILELVKSKCLPILLYGLELFSLNISDVISLDFTVIRFLTKLFKSSNINVGIILTFNYQVSFWWKEKINL